MQFEFLRDILLQRKLSDGSPQCYDASETSQRDVRHGVPSVVQCLRESDGYNQGSSDLARQEHIVMTIELIRVRHGGREGVA